MSATAYRLLHGASVPGASRAESASNALALEHLWLAPVRCRALGLRRTHAAWDDAVQEGSIALLHVARRFDAGRGAPFEAYARSWVDSAIKACLSRLGVVSEPVRRVRDRAARGERAHPLTAAAVEELADCSTGEDELLERLDRSRFEAWVRERLAELEPKVADSLMAHCRDIGTCEYAERVGLSRDTIRQRKNAGLEYLRDYADTAPVEGEAL